MLHMLNREAGQIVDSFLRENFFRDTHMPSSTSNRIVQNAARNSVLHPPLGKSLNLTEKNEGPCHWSTRVSLLKKQPEAVNAFTTGNPFWGQIYLNLV